MQPVAQRGLGGTWPATPSGQAAPVAPQALAELLAEQGEGPEVQQQLQGPRQCGLEVDEQHPGEEQQEKEVADHVAHEGRHRRPPELSPAAQTWGAPPTTGLTHHPQGHLLGGVRWPGGERKRKGRKVQADL